MTGSSHVIVQRHRKIVTNVFRILKTQNDANSCVLEDSGLFIVLVKKINDM